MNPLSETGQLTLGDGIVVDVEIGDRCWIWSEESLRGFKPVGNHIDIEIKIEPMLEDLLIDECKKCGSEPNNKLTLNCKDKQMGVDLCFTNLTMIQSNYYPHKFRLLYDGEEIEKIACCGKVE